jgi:hypothetical protein
MMTAQNTFSYCDVIGFQCANADFSAKDHVVPSCLLLCCECIDFVLHNFEISPMKQILKIQIPP